MGQWKNLPEILRKLSDRQKIILTCSVIVVLVGVLSGVFFLVTREDTNSEVAGELASESQDMTDTVIESENITDETNTIEETETFATEGESTTEGNTASEPIENAEADPQEEIREESPQGDGAQVNVTDVADEIEEETAAQELTFGIDVSKYQGTIDWEKVAESGIDFAMIRVGYRTLINGEIVADNNARYNMQEAQKYGIKVGVYFFSTAVSVEEAKEEANWVADYIAKYKITYPVAYDCEGFESADSRQYTMTKTERTDVAIAFLNEIENRGYEGMFYASKRDLEGERAWEVSRLSDFKIWVAQYPSTPYPETSKSTYSGAHAMWQYTNQGSIPGISKKVDVNVAYFGYDTEQGAQDSEKPEDVEADVEALMKFTDVNESVTAKEKTNLRDKPSQGSDSTVVYTLLNGEVATRTGVSDSGWSRVEYQGQVLYAVTSYLTTELISNPPTEEEDTGDEVQTKFTDVNEKVTAKEVVNLRLKPTVDDEIGPVIAQLTNGEVVIRTGINTDLGWSRVEYNGQVLYCVSSYLMPAE